LHKHKTKISTRQGCELLSLSRNGLYYKPVKNKDGDLCSLILDIWLERNNKGWRSIQADLKEYHELIVNHKKLRRIMRGLGIRGISPKKNTSKSNKAHYKYPYGLKHLEICRANMA